VGGWVGGWVGYARSKIKNKQVSHTLSFLCEGSSIHVTKLHLTHCFNGYGTTKKKQSKRSVPLPMLSEISGMARGIDR